MTGHIYKGQTLLRIQLDTGLDVTSMQAVYVGYKKPSGATGYWTAVKGTGGDTTKVYYDVTGSTDLNEVGDWLFWAKVVSAGGLIAEGEPWLERVRAVGTR